MLTTRQQTVLNLIVDSYVRSATPVASETIARSPELNVSPATVRNDVAHLEEEGYLSRPHASAGSVPLDTAYRFHVESVAAMEVEFIPQIVKWSIRRRLGEVEQDVDEWASVAASALADQVGNMAIATLPKAKETRVRHVELVHLQDFLAMFIVIIEQARLRKQLIRLDEQMEPAELETSANRVKTQLTGLTRKQIESAELQLTPLEQKLVEATILTLRDEDRAAYREHNVHGLRNLLSQPEFGENEKLRPLIDGLEDGTLIQAILEETPDADVVRVIIGQENRGDMLWPLSVVICRYGIPEEAVGVLGAIGPTRMDYANTIRGVKFTSSVMSELVESVSSA